jgi:hypothetical protein
MFSKRELGDVELVNLARTLIQAEKAHIAVVTLD